MIERTLGMTERERMKCDEGTAEDTAAAHGDQKITPLEHNASMSHVAHLPCGARLCKGTDERSKTLYGVGVAYVGIVQLRRVDREVPSVHAIEVRPDKYQGERSEDNASQSHGAPLPGKIASKLRPFYLEVPELDTNRVRLFTPLARTEETHNPTRALRVCQLLRVGPLDQELVRRAKLRRQPPLAEDERRVPESRIVGDPLKVCRKSDWHVRQKRRLTADAMHVGLFIGIGDAL